MTSRVRFAKGKSAGSLKSRQVARLGLTVCQMDLKVDMLPHSSTAQPPVKLHPTALSIDLVASRLYETLYSQVTFL